MWWKLEKHLLTDSHVYLYCLHLVWLGFNVNQEIPNILSRLKTLTLIAHLIQMCRGLFLYHWKPFSLCNASTLSIALKEEVFGRSNQNIGE